MQVPVSGISSPNIFLFKQANTEVLHGNRVSTLM